jgi:hypothetical protein
VEFVGFISFSPSGSSTCARRVHQLVCDKFDKFMKEDKQSRAA